MYIKLICVPICELCGVVPIFKGESETRKVEEVFPISHSNCESSEAVELSEGGEKTQNQELENLSSGVDLVPHLPSCD